MRENLEVTMNMVKSLLLGSAAGLVAVAGAQAADLPVKAKPVEYVKVCSAYGAGFYYIPGTDICLRVGGYVWSEFEVNNFGAGPNYATGAIGGDSIRNRNDDWTSFRVRFDMVFDARTNTEYGTLRSYASVGWQWTTNLDGFQQQQLPATTGNYAWYYDRAFIQFAGLTFGYVGSFFDFDPSLVLNQQTSKSFKFTPAIAYTAQLGSGISASISMEDSTTRRTNITTSQGTSQAGGTAGIQLFGYFSPSSNIGICGATLGPPTGSICNNNLLVVPIAIQDSGFGANLYSGQYMPDFVANLRVDQAWGDAQISGAVHQLKTALDGLGLAFTNGTGTPTKGLPLAPVKYGYAALAGINFKLPTLGAGDSVQVEGAWSKGAVDYTGVSANPYSNASSLGYRKGAVGPVIDLFDSYVDGNGQHLATAYSLNAELRHFWTPTIRSSIAYGYNKFKVPAAAQDPAQSIGGFGTGSTTFPGNFPSGTINQVTANLIWSPVPKLDLGVEGVWFRMKTDCGGLTAAECAAPAELTRGKTADTIGGVFRARRDF
jgi:Porin subfamily